MHKFIEEKMNSAKSESELTALNALRASVDMYRSLPKEAKVDYILAMDLEAVMSTIYQAIRECHAAMHEIQTSSEPSEAPSEKNS